MFKKIVSNLPFSPALVGQLSFYANRLRKEEVTRRLGLIFIIFTLVIQSLAVFQPPESANASSQYDMVEGGVTSINDFLYAYDNNVKNLRDVMNYVGITRNEIASTSYGAFVVDNTINWSFASRLSSEQGERTHNVSDSNDKYITTIYSRPLNMSYNSSASLNAWIGNSSTIGWFAILQSCGNLETKKYPSAPTIEKQPVIETEIEEEEIEEEEPIKPKKCAVRPSILASDEDCVSCPGDESLWAYDSDCKPKIVKSKKAINLTQGYLNATKNTAKSGDKIAYTITIKNEGLDSETVRLKDDIADILEYSKLDDNGGGSLDATNKVLSWSSIALDPGEKQTRTYVIKVLDTIPATAKGYSDPTSYDCVMTNVFGNSVNIPVDCPTPKIVENISSELPQTGPGENILFACILLAVGTYFFMRTRQLGKEVKIIRHNTCAGTL